MADQHGIAARGVQRAIGAVGHRQRRDQPCRNRAPCPRRRVARWWSTGGKGATGADMLGSGASAARHRRTGAGRNGCGAETSWRAAGSRLKCRERRPDNAHSSATETGASPRSCHPGGAAWPRWRLARARDRPHGRRIARPADAPARRWWRRWRKPGQGQRSPLRPGREAIDPAPPAGPPQRRAAAAALVRIWREIAGRHQRHAGRLRGRGLCAGRGRHHARLAREHFGSADPAAQPVAARPAGCRPRSAGDGPGGGAAAAVGDRAARGAWWIALLRQTPRLQWWPGCRSGRRAPMAPAVQALVVAPGRSRSERCRPVAAAARGRRATSAAPG